MAGDATEFPWKGTFGYDCNLGEKPPSWDMAGILFSPVCLYHVFSFPETLWERQYNITIAKSACPV